MGRGSRTGHQGASEIDVGRLAGATVAAVWAHPDDESYLGGGLMASLAGSGSRVVNVTATLGELGVTNPAATPHPDAVAEMRGKELIEALDKLDVHESVVLGFDDGGLADVPVDVGVRRLSTVLDEILPDLVVSFGADGVTGHPDHIAIGEWTARWVSGSTSQPALIETAAGRGWPADLVAAMHDVNAFLPGYPDRRPSLDDVALHLPDDVLEAKLAALRCHASQTGSVRHRLGPAGYRRLAAVETFRPANLSAKEILAGSHHAVMPKLHGSVGAPSRLRRRPKDPVQIALPGERRSHATSRDLPTVGGGHDRLTRVSPRSRHRALRGRHRR